MKNWINKNYFLISFTFENLIGEMTGCQEFLAQPELTVYIHSSKIIIHAYVNKKVSRYELQKRYCFMFTFTINFFRMFFLHFVLRKSREKR